MSTAVQERLTAAVQRYKDFHFQHPGIRDSFKIEVFPQDHCDIDIKTHWDESRPMHKRARVRTTQFLRPVFVCDPDAPKGFRRKVIVPRRPYEYDLMSLRSFAREFWPEAGTVNLNLDTKGSGLVGTVFDEMNGATVAGASSTPGITANLMDQRQKIALFQSIVSGTAVNFDDTLANSAYAAGQWTSTNELTGGGSTGYVAGGAGVGTVGASFIGTTSPDGNPTWANTDGVVAFGGPSAVWNAVDFTATNGGDGAHGGLIYFSALTPKYATVFIDFGQGYVPTSGPFQVQWNSLGIWTWTLHNP